jgi:dUTP pyrophosphatase
MKVKISLLNPLAKLPAYGREGDAGLDLFSCEDCVLAPGERHLFKLGFALELPAGTVGLMWDRSGIATNHGIHALAGVIDSNYRGEVCCVLYNTSSEPYTIKKGDKIAQMIIQKFEQVDFEQVEKLSESARGDRGWFSSGR